MVRLESGVDKSGVPIVSAAQLDMFAHKVLMDYKPALLQSPQAIDIELLAEQYFDACLEIRHITPNHAILGMTVFGDCELPIFDMWSGQYVGLEVRKGTILVEQGIYNSHEPGRFNFTIAHEAAGHLACHERVNIIGGTVCRKERGSMVFMCASDLVLKTQAQVQAEKWLEWQADYMAGAILMPMATVPMAVEDILFHAGIMGGDSGKREMARDRQLTMHVAKSVGKLYGASNQAATIRLKHLHIIQ